MSFSVWTRTRLILEDLRRTPRRTRWRRSTPSTTAGTTGSSSTSTTRSIKRQVLRHGRLRHHDDRVPPRHGPLLLRGDHADLPLVARTARRAAVLRGRRRDRLLPDPLLQPAARPRSPAQDGRSASTATTTPGRRPKFVGFSVRGAMWVMLFHGLLRWWKAELANAWTYVVRAAADREPGRGPAPSRSRPAPGRGALSRGLPSHRSPRRSSPEPRAASGSSSRRSSPGTATTSSSSRGEGSARRRRARTDRGVRRAAARRCPRILPAAEAPAESVRELEARAISVDVLVNNAGFGDPWPLRRDARSTTTSR